MRRPLDLRRLQVRDAPVTQDLRRHQTPLLHARSTVVDTAANLVRIVEGEVGLETELVDFMLLALYRGTTHRRADVTDVDDAVVVLVEVAGRRNAGPGIRWSGRGCVPRPTQRRCRSRTTSGHRQFGSLFASDVWPSNSRPKLSLISQRRFRPIDCSSSLVARSCWPQAMSFGELSDSCRNTVVATSSLVSKSTRANGRLNQLPWDKRTSCFRSPPT